MPTAESFLPYRSEDKLNQMYADLIDEKITVEEKTTKGWVASVGAALQLLSGSLKGKSMQESVNEIHDKRTDVIKKLVERSRQDVDLPTLSDYPESDEIYYQVSGEFGFYPHPEDEQFVQVKGVTEDEQEFVADCSKSNFSSGSWPLRAASENGIYIDGYALATVFKQTDENTDKHILHFGFIAQVSDRFSIESEKLE